MGLRAKDANVPAQKPARGMAKQKGETSLKSLQGAHKPLVSENEQPTKPARQLRKRKSQETESMEVEPATVSPQQVDQDVEMEVEVPRAPLGFSTKNLFHSISTILTARTLM